jgi:hypothetical protein
VRCPRARFAGCSFQTHIRLAGFTVNMWTNYFFQAKVSNDAICPFLCGDHKPRGYNTDLLTTRNCIIWGPLQKYSLEVLKFPATPQGIGNSRRKYLIFSKVASSTLRRFLKKLSILSDTCRKS